LLSLKSKIKIIINKIFLLTIILTITVNPGFTFYSKFITPSHDKEEQLLQNNHQFSDIEQALIASEVNPDTFDLYTSEILRWKNEIQESLPNYHSQKQIAQAIGHYLHGHVYTKYKFNATTLKEVFETGFFNCLSSTILMNILLKAFGIEAKTIVLPTHVYTLAIIDGVNTEIENTIREGLSISQDKASQKRFNQLTGFDYNSNSKQKVIITWTESIGLLYSNRSYFDAKKKDHYKAFQSMMKAQALLANAPSEQKNLTAGYLNYSYYTYKNENKPLQTYLKTLSILEEGMSRYPDQKALKGNYLKGLDIVLNKIIPMDNQDSNINTLMESAKNYLIANDFIKLQKSRYIRIIVHTLRTNVNYKKAKENIQFLWQLDSNDKDTQDLIQEYSFSLVQNELKNNTIISNNSFILKELSTFPSNLTSDSLGCYYSGLARKYFKNSQFKDSVDIMIEAKNKLGSTRLISQNGFVYAINSAQHFVQNDSIQEALQFYTKALQFKKDRQVLNNISILYERLVIEAVNKKKFTLVKQLLKQGKEVIPNDSRLKLLINKYG